MIFSDALPVQLWTSDCETFNEREVDGVNYACWCQPFNCDDEINVQFRHTANQILYLGITSRSGEILSAIQCVEISDGIYSASFVPSDEGICNEDIRIGIYQNNGDEVLDNTDFNEEMAPWESVDIGNATWFFEDGGFVEIHLPAATAGASDPLRQDFSVSPAGYYILTLRMTILSVNSEERGVVVKVFLDDDLVQEIYNEVIHPIPLQDYATIVNINGPFNRIEITAIGSLSYTNAPDLQVTRVSLKSISELNAVLAKSDCLSIRTDHAETELIRYSNNRNYYGLVYDDISPFQVFYLRVPCVFFHERYPQEDMAIERTGSTIISSSKMKVQRLMQVKHAPDYFHKKLIMVLSQHNVEIQGRQWKKEEAYEKEEGDARYPLKRATVYLTDKNYLARNVF